MSYVIDVHHHILPDFFWRETNEGASPVGGIAPPPWDQAGALSFMNDAGIDVAVTSISAPGVHVGDDARARYLARRCNELAADMVQGRPDRFGGFAALPLPDVDGALNELAYSLDVLKLDGVVLFSNANGVYWATNGSSPCSRRWNVAALLSSFIRPPSNATIPVFMAH
jgi:6-methylsalicylate decarboxylase